MGRLRLFPCCCCARCSPACTAKGSARDAAPAAFAALVVSRSAASRWERSVMAAGSPRSDAIVFPSVRTAPTSIRGRRPARSASPAQRSLVVGEEGPLQRRCSPTYSVWPKAARTRTARSACRRLPAAAAAAAAEAADINGLSEGASRPTAEVSSNLRVAI